MHRLSFPDVKRLGSAALVGMTLVAAVGVAHAQGMSVSSR
ncbi:phosphatidylethanolamine-binding protein [Pandoraea captiosa]|jgi:hypothetical protein|uniref:Phosphatidylethanolamine-binding protein n=1 Tax=Pandoraea captiosa TaxID=2508302 RepID=A0A5E4ZIE6_9BURK|nr:phosphatidylethanolamine-binding protein [Pandoraea captiosa]